MKIKDVKYTYVDKKYQLGPYMDFIGELEVQDDSYESIVSVISRLHPEYKAIEVMCFTKS